MCRNGKKLRLVGNGQVNSTFLFKDVFGWTGEAAWMGQRRESRERIESVQFSAGEFGSLGFGVGKRGLMIYHVP